jgi:hypothetical protein
MVTEVSPALPSGWWRRTVAREADRNRLGLGERIGNIIGIFFILLFFLILIDIQLSGVGFFTDQFGPLGLVLFYGSLLYGIFPALLRAFTANRNLGRLADLVGSLIFVVAAIYLVVVFPFDVPSLLDYVFGPAGDAFSWITNELVRMVLLFALLVTVVSASYNAALYLSVRNELKRRQASAPGPGT